MPLASIHAVGNLESIQFSIADGGALAQMLRKRGILGPKRHSILLRILCAALITWLPLLIFTAFSGDAIGDKVRIPFLFDLIQHARFLVALPVAIGAESYINPRFRGVLGRFLEGNILSGDDVARLTKAVSRASSVKDSWVVEILMIALACLYMSLRLERSLIPGLTSWHHPGSLAELWFLWVSMPIFIFFWIRWFWRLGIWTFLLFRISMLKLRLTATHPDNAGGLAFISVGQRRLSVLVFAISAIASASIGEEILFFGQSLRTFESELVAFFVICVLVVMGPLMVFSPQMIQAKLKGWREYGLLASAYTQKFNDKWIPAGERSLEKLLGSPDIQSLSDLKNSYEGISQMRTILPDRKSVIILLIAFCLPIIPLLTTVIPLRQILSQLFKLLAG